MKISAARRIFLIFVYFSKFIVCQFFDMELDICL